MPNRTTFIINKRLIEPSQFRKGTIYLCPKQSFLICIKTNLKLKQVLMLWFFNPNNVNMNIPQTTANYMPFKWAATFVPLNRKIILKQPYLCLKDYSTLLRIRYKGFTASEQKLIDNKGELGYSVV